MFDRLMSTACDATRCGQPRRPGAELWVPAWRDRSLLVEIFLSERKPDDAWREAKEGGCSQAFWLQPAEIREKTHPHDALTVYRDYIPKVLAQTNNRAYEEAICFLHKLRALYAAVGEPKAFQNYLTELRIACRAKRNFIKLLDQEDW